MRFLVYIIFLIACYRCSARELSDTNITLIANSILKDTATLSQRTTLYLNSDKDKYLTGEALWFNVFVFNAQTFTPSIIDTNVLLLLRSENNDSIVWSGSYQIQNTHSSGRVTIADSLPTGKYILTAYTPHSFFKHQNSIRAAKELFIAQNYDAIRTYNKSNTSLDYDITRNDRMAAPIYSKQQLINIERNTRNNIRFKIYSNCSDYGKYYLRLQCRGMLEKIAVIRKLKDSAIVGFSTKGLASGITEVELFDNKLKPVAERLVFIHPEDHLYVSVDTLKQQYGPKEKVILKIHTQDIYGRPVSTLLSVKAIDRRFLNEGPQSDIWTHTQLFSQLKEVICNFENNNSWMPKALDNLLVKEDYHSYNWNSDELDKIASDTPVLMNRYKARLIRKNGKLNKKPISFLAFNPFNRKESRKIIASTDSTGYFDVTPEMQSLGSYYMLKYFSESNQKLIALTHIDTIKLVNKSFTHTIREPYSTKVKTDTTIFNKTEDRFSNNERVVNITAKDNALNRYLSILDSTDYAETPDIITPIYHVPWNGHGERSLIGERHSKPLIDKNRTDVLTTENKFGNLYLVVAPIKDTTKPLDYTLFDKFNLIEMKGYNTNKEFNAPDYTKEDTTVDDYRNTLYWNPEIITDTNGNAIVEFYTSDVRGAFNVTVEGVSGNGLLGSFSTSFVVRKEENTQ